MKGGVVAKMFADAGRLNVHVTKIDRWRYSSGTWDVRTMTRTYKNIVIRFEVAQFDVDLFLKTCILNHLCSYRYPPGESMPGTRMRL